jgi:thiol reductant ABC exporter CydC subunit
MRWTSLRGWLGRSRPAPRRLLGALGLTLLAGACSLGLLGGSGLLVGRAAQGGSLAALGALLVAIEIVAFLRSPLRYEERLVVHRVALGSMVRWRTWLFDALCRLAPGLVARTASGDLLDRAIEDVDALDDLWVRVVLPAMSALLTGALGALVALLVRPAAGIALLVALGLGLSVAVAASRGCAGLAEAEAEARALATAAAVDLLDGMVELSAAGTATVVRSRIEDAERRRARLAARLARRRAVGAGVESLVAGLGVAVVVVLAGRAAHAGQLSGPGALGLGLLGVAALEPLGLLALAAVRAGEVEAAGRRLEHLGAPAGEVPRGAGRWAEGAHVVLESVAARPVPGAPPVLRSVDLDLAPGDRVAVLGSSGAGKSTLGDVLVGLLTPEAGRARAGGVDLAAMDPTERTARVALVDQSTELLSGTVADALRLAAPEADDDQLRVALDAVGLHELDLDRQVGERASALSGGEARRVALARAVLRTPSLLVLDEPTAGLDEAQGRAVLEAALGALPSAAVVLLTHRSGEAALADVAFELVEGRLLRTT